MIEIIKSEMVEQEKMHGKEIVPKMNICFESVKGKTQNQYKIFIMKSIIIFYAVGASENTYK